MTIPQLTAGQKLLESKLSPENKAFLVQKKHFYTFHVGLLFFLKVFQVKWKILPFSMENLVTEPSLLILMCHILL